MPCDRTDQRPERVCLLTGNGSPLCATPAQVQQRGAWKRFGQTVAGFAPAGARWAEVRAAGNDDVELVAVQDGVFGASLATAATDVRFR